MILFLIMILPEESCSGLKRWCDTNEAISQQPPAGCVFYMERVNEVVDGKKLLRYSIQLSMLKQLHIQKLIDENEYQIIKKKLMKDYGVVSNITA